jgi:LmbE family N-acetylglucosaminyl deacetylase
VEDRIVVVHHRVALSDGKGLSRAAGPRLPPLPGLETLLYVVPHSDDEAFGGGLICRSTSHGHAVHLALVTAARDLYQAHARRIVRAEERQSEFRASARILGVQEDHIHTFRGEDSRLDMIPRAELIGWLEGLIRATGASALLLPYPSHHQDHEQVYLAGRAVLRTGAARALRLAGIWEYPYILSDACGEVAHLGRLTFDITGEPMRAKLRALAAHRSQFEGRGRYHPISARGVKLLAAVRGMEIGRPCGESYYLLKGAIR